MPSPHVKIVVAYSDNRTIGRDNALPWRLPGDLAHFKQTTLGHPIVMGRKTWDSLGRPLPGRRNIVVSRQPHFAAAGASVFGSLAEALRDCADEDSISIIGGAQIYRLALPLADEIVATEVHAEVEGDAHFPPIEAGEWQETQRLAQQPENGYAYDFVTYRRVTPGLTPPPPRGA